MCGFPSLFHMPPLCVFTASVSSSKIPKGTENMGKLVLDQGFILRRGSNSCLANSSFLTTVPRREVGPKQLLLSTEQSEFQWKQKN